MAVQKIDTYIAIHCDGFTLGPTAQATLVDMKGAKFNTNKVEPEDFGMYSRYLTNTGSSHTSES